MAYAKSKAAWPRAKPGPRTDSTRPAGGRPLRPRPEGTPPVPPKPAPKPTFSAEGVIKDALAQLWGTGAVQSFGVDRDSDYPNVRGR